MGHRLRCRLTAALLPLFGAALFGLAGERPVSGQDANAGEPPLLTRGPIHEAFAEPINFNPKPGPLIPRQPPANIEEIPPDQKPDGDNVSWIPGYWHWDDDKNEFLWVSGFWRVMPPGRQWIPGYWNQVDDKWQWVSGYWANQEQKEAVYLPEPPATLENGPQTPQPSNDHIWVPGTWVYRETRYLWQPGYWIVGWPGWIWVPACYVWTPCGYVFVDGYWDYSLRRRGCLFAPFYYDVVYVRPGWVYRPTVCIDIDVVTAHLWCRPRFGHYYFGDYYDATYINLGFTPWFNFTYARGGYCPIYTYHAWYFRGRNPGWDAALRADYQFRFAHVDARPPRTFVQQQVIINNITNVTNVNINNTTVVNNQVLQFNRNQVQTLALAKPMNQLVARANADADAPLRFQRVNEEQIRQAVARQQELRQAYRQRLELERATAAKLLPAGGTGNGIPAGAGSREGEKPTPAPGGGAPTGAAPGGATASGGPGSGRLTPRPVVPTAPIKVELPKTPIVAKPLPANDGGADKLVAGRPTRTPPPVPRSLGSVATGGSRGGAGTSGAAKPGGVAPALPTNPGPVTGGEPAVKPLPTAAAGEEGRPGPRPAVPTNVARPAITKPALPSVNPPAGAGNPATARPVPSLPGRDLRPPIAPIPSKPIPLPSPRSGGSSDGGLGTGGEPNETKPPAVKPTPQPKPPAVGGSSGSSGSGNPPSDPAANPPVIRPRPIVPPPAGMPPGASGGPGSGGAGSGGAVSGPGTGGSGTVKPPMPPSLPPSQPPTLPPRAQPTPQPPPQPNQPAAGPGSGSSGGGVGIPNPPPIRPQPPASLKNPPAPPASQSPPPPTRSPSPPPAVKTPPPASPPPSRTPAPQPSARPPAPPPAVKSPPPASAPPSRTPPPPPPKTPPPKSDGKSP